MDPLAPSSAVNGSISVERLHHFRCGACQQWWSIGDAPVRPRWFCPWCGRENSFPAAGAEAAGAAPQERG